jgi:hypothetical protein
VVSLISGVVADKGFLPLSLVAVIFFAAIIAEIFTFFVRSSKLANTYLKPVTFFAYALCFGGLIGNLFLEAPRSERKL